jgi:hypothetical protein
VCFVEFVTQARHAAPGDHGGVTLHSPSAALGGFHLLGDFVDVGVKRLQQFPRLRRVGVIDHVRIIASAAAKRAPGPTEAGSAGVTRCRFPGMTHACRGNDCAVAY